MVILLFGPPGSGKGTQASALLKWLPYRIPSVSTGEMLRAEIAAGSPLGKQTRSVIAAGGLVGDDIINPMLAARVRQPDCKEGFMLDGYPRTLPQAVFLDSLLTDLGMQPPIVIHLDVPGEILISRMISRRQCSGCGSMFNILSKRPRVPGRCDACDKPLVVRKDDREKVIRERLRAYDAQTEPVLGYYRDGHYLHIPGDQPPASIFDSITQGLESMISKPVAL